LIVHEIVFALVKPVEVNGQLFQLSAHARDITGLFFTPQFSWMTKSGLRQFGVHERLPMESSSFALLHEDKALAQVSYDGRLYLHGYIRNKRGGFGWHDLIIGVNDDMDSLKKKVEKYCSLSTFEKENNWKIDRNVSLHYVESGTALKHSRLSSNDTYLEFWNWESGNPRSRAISRRPLAEMRIENMKHCQETLIYGMRDYLNYRY